MQMPFLWALIHSLWIGIIAAALTGGIIICGGRWPSRIRYTLFCAVLGLFVVSTCVAGWRQYQAAAMAGWHEALTKPAATGSPLSAGDTGSLVFQEFGLSGKFTALVDQYAVWLFAVWLLFFSWKVTRFAGGIYYVHRLKYHGILEDTGAWQEKVVVLGRKLGIRGGVRLLQSQKVTIPLTVGFFKPVILLPVGLLLQLPPAYIESILLHELAHIRRRDYLINLFQQFLEAIFFFNPAVLWISRLIREEREACCDEIVISHVPQKASYLNALLTFQEAGALDGKLAMTLGGKRNQLRNRFYRMTGMGSQQLTFMEACMLLAGVVLLSVFSVMAQEPGMPLQDKIKHHPVTTNQPGLKGTDQRSIHPVKTVVKAPAVRAPVKKKWFAETRRAADTTDWTRYKLSKQMQADVENKVLNQQADKNQPFDNSTIAADVERIKVVVQALLAEGIVDTAADIDWFGLSETELVVNGQKQPAVLHEKLKTQTQVRPGHGLYYGPVKMTGQGFFLDKQDLAKL